MKQLKILIAVATWNRPNVTRLCLENLQEIRGPNAAVMIYDDCSSAYDVSFLDRYCDGLLRFRLHGGIERSRARAFRDFVHRYSEFDILYLTDNDTIHDPRFIDVLNEFFTEQEGYPFAHPVGFFRSVFHEKAIEQQFEKFVVSRTCPGVSQAYNREMAEKIVHLLDTNPMMETVYGWDYHWPATLKRPFRVSTNSFVEHFARELKEGGLHCPATSESEERVLDDLGRDRALRPTGYLKNIRLNVINRILKPREVTMTTDSPDLEPQKPKALQSL
jgi:hypothetical protein